MKMDGATVKKKMLVHIFKNLCCIKTNCYKGTD